VFWSAIFSRTVAGFYKQFFHVTAAGVYLSRQAVNTHGAIGGINLLHGKGQKMLPNGRYSQFFQKKVSSIGHPLNQFTNEQV